MKPKHERIYITGCWFMLEGSAPRGFAFFAGQAGQADVTMLLLDSRRGARTVIFGGEVRGGGFVDNEGEAIHTNSILSGQTVFQSWLQLSELTWHFSQKNMV
jgi:hypothetical protein